MAASCGGGPGLLGLHHPDPGLGPCRGARFMTSSEGPWPRTLAYQPRAPYLVLGGPDPSLPLPLPRRLGGSRTWSLQARTSGGPVGSAERRNRSGPTSSTGSSTPHTRPLSVCAPGDQAMDIQHTTLGMATSGPRPLGRHSAGRGHLRKRCPKSPQTQGFLAPRFYSEPTWQETPKRCLYSILERGGGR